MRPAAKTATKESLMSKRLILAAALAAFVATPALAGHCPADVKAIDAGLAKMSLSAAKMSEIKALRNKGNAQHKAGQHKQSTNTLAKAMRMLLTSK